MQINPDEITNILKSRIEGLDSGTAELTEVGTVLSVADGIARLHGLENCMSFEMLELPHGVTGLALNLESDNVGAVLFGEWEKVSEGDTVKRTGSLLEIPVGESVQFNLSSPDVIHAFWVPEFLFKRDVVPGHPNHFAITATKTGTFIGHCSELCGLYHSRMLFTVKIVTPAQFHSWISQQQAIQKTASGSTQ